MSRGSPDLETQTRDSSSFMKKRPRWPLIVLGIILLLSGMVIGAAGDFYIHKMMRDNFIKHPERAPRLITKRLKSELDLSPAQAEQVEIILTKRLKTLKQIQEECRSPLDEELNVLRDEVLQTLDENQAQRWRKHFAKARHFLPPPTFERRNGKP